MFKNYLKIAFRSLLKYRLFSLVNVFGLTLGMTCCLLISVYVQDERSYDSHFSDADRIYRANCRYYLPKDAGYEDNAAIGPGPAEFLAKDFPEVETVTRLRSDQNVLIQNKTTHEKIYENVMYTDSTFFSIFSFSFLHGDARHALDKPFSAVISKNAAIKHFGKTDVVGETLWLPKDSVYYKIMGVLDDTKFNSHIRFDYMVNLSTLKYQGYRIRGWWNFSYHTFLKLKSNASASKLQGEIQWMSKRYIENEEKMSGYRQEYSLTALKDIHLNSHLRGELSANGNASSVSILALVGILVLILACVNFMNLSTARSVLRAKEVGLRKVVGAYHRQLIAQFLMESFVVSLIALILSVVFSEVALPYVNQLTLKKLELDFLSDPQLFSMAVLMTLVSGFAAGLYPAFVLSSFQPISTLKGQFKSQLKGILIRKGMVVLQFAISIALIASIMLIYRQLNFMQNAELGFSKERVIYIPMHEDRTTRQAFYSLRDALKQVPSVTATSISSNVPGQEMGNNVVRLGWDDKAAWNDMRFLSADESFLELYGLKLIAGRFFDKKNTTDENEAFLINESAVTRLGFSGVEAALNQPLGWQNKKGRVIGVIQDFHFRSLQYSIDPFIMVMSNHFMSHLSIRVHSDDFKSAITEIESKFREFFPDRNMEFHFVDQEFEAQYAFEHRFGQIFLIFTVLSLLVACLGLFGLANFSTQLRIKEIGVRKILGANIRQVSMLLCSEFVVLVLLSAAVGLPAAYFAGERWLENFAYKTNLDWSIFAFSGFLSLIIATMTVGIQAFKAASANPVKALKYE